MWPTHRPSSDWLEVRSLGVTIINLLAPTGLGSTAGGQHAVSFSHLGASVPAQQLTEHSSILSIALEGEVKALGFILWLNTPSVLPDHGPLFLRFLTALSSSPAEVFLHTEDKVEHKVKVKTIRLSSISVSLVTSPLSVLMSFI